jgi:hypothetical protein
MGRIYQLVKNNYTLTPDQTAFFDRIFRDAQANLDALESRDAAAPGSPAIDQNRENVDKDADRNADSEAPLWQPDMSGDDEVINDPNASYTEKAGAVVDKAGKAYTAARLDPADWKHGPTAALISRAMRIADPAERARVTGEIRALRDQYAGTDAEFKAPNGKPSLLLEALGEEKGREAWYAVRTPSFKNWFGDWERTARIEAIRGITPVSIKAVENSPSKPDVKTIFKNFGAVKNEHDGRSAIFPSETAGKVLRHKGFETGKIVEQFADLFKTAFFAYSEDETHREGHKTHPNIKAYHNYVNKFEYDGRTYYLRFTLHEEAVKQGTGRNNVHSSFISDIALYNDNGETTNQVRVIDPVERSVSPSSDKKLAQFFDSVKPSEVSQVRDANGEPLPVYRGDKAGLDRFLNRQGIYHAADADVARGYSSGGLYKDFLNIKNPLVLNEQSFNAVREDINDMMQEILEQDWSELENNRQFQDLRENYLAFRNEEGSAIRDFYNGFLPEVSEKTDLEEFKEVLLKSLHDTNTFNWRQIDFRDIDVLNPLRMEQKGA